MFRKLYQLSKKPRVGAIINFVGYGYLALWNRIFCAVPSYLVRYLIIKYLYGMKIGRSNLHSHVRMLSPWNITIGNNVNIQMNSFLDGRGGISIGNNVDITIGVRIFTQQHDIDSADYATVTKRVEIKDNVVIGSYALILPGVTIGEGAVVGAGSVVPRSIPAFEFHAGNPAAFKRSRKAVPSYRLNYRRPFH